jgi:hypothetical protein
LVDILKTGAATVAAFTIFNLANPSDTKAQLQEGTTEQAKPAIVIFNPNNPYISEVKKLQSDVDYFLKQGDLKNAKIWLENIDTYNQTFKNSFGYDPAVKEMSDYCTIITPQINGTIARESNNASKASALEKKIRKDLKKRKIDAAKVKLEEYQKLAAESLSEVDNQMYADLVNAYTNRINEIGTINAKTKQKHNKALTKAKFLRTPSINEYTLNLGGINPSDVNQVSDNLKSVINAENKKVRANIGAYNEFTASLPWVLPKGERFYTSVSGDFKTIDGTLNMDADGTIIPIEKIATLDTGSYNVTAGKIWNKGSIKCGLGVGLDGDYLLSKSTEVGTATPNTFTTIDYCAGPSLNGKLRFDDNLTVDLNARYIQGLQTDNFGTKDECLYGGSIGIKGRLLEGKCGALDVDVKVGRDKRELRERNSSTLYSITDIDSRTADITYSLPIYKKWAVGFSAGYSEKTEKGNGSTKEYKEPRAGIVVTYGK